MHFVFTHKITVLDSDLETPVGFFIRLVGEQQGILFESSAEDGKWGRYSIIALDFLFTAICRDGALALDVADEQLSGLKQLEGMPYHEGLQQLTRSIRIEKDPHREYPAITRALYGNLGYEIAALLQPKLAKTLFADAAEACMVLPGKLLLFDHLYNKITQMTLTFEGRPLRTLPGNSPVRPSPSTPASECPLAGEQNYVDAVLRVRKHICQGEAIQVVLSTPFSAPLDESPFTIYRRLRRINPSPYMFYMRLPTGVLLGSSPEVLISCEANHLRLCPIAGTRPRSTDVTEDMLFSDDLLQDPKEKAEHVMLVDLGRNDLGRIAVTGSVKLERFMEVERFSHVMHLSSRISAELAPGLTALDVLAASFPAGTVSGAPKIRAMEIIAEEEQVPRGPYAGAIGWLGLDDDSVNLDFGITIRSLWIRDGQVRWQAGAGIVFDSIPEKEWLECQAKASVIRKVLFGDD